jgi:hypothetical protein
VDATNEIAQCIITSPPLLPILPPGSKESATTGIFVAQFQYNKLTIPYMSPRRNFKNYGRWHKKSGRTEQSGINLRNTAHQPAKMSSKTFCTEQQVEKSIGKYAQGVEENNKRYQENPQLYRTTRDKRTSGTIKDNGVTITQFNGTRKVNGEHSLSCWYTTSNARSIYWACLIPNSKMELTLQSTACFVCITNYFRLYKDSITNQLQFAA